MPCSKFPEKACTTSHGSILYMTLADVAPLQLALHTVPSAREPFRAMCTVCTTISHANLEGNQRDNPFSGATKLTKAIHAPMRHVRAHRIPTGSDPTLSTHALPRCQSPRKSSKQSSSDRLSKTHELFVLLASPRKVRV